MPALSPDRSSLVTTEVVVIRSEDCHLCEDAIEALTDLSGEFPLDVRVVDASSSEGRELLRLHRPPLTPGVRVGGRRFSSGRLPRKKLRRMLEGRR